jgi:hypothetical protein
MVVLKLAKGNKSGGCFWARAQAQQGNRKVYCEASKTLSRY